MKRNKLSKEYRDFNYGWIQIIFVIALFLIIKYLL